MHLLRDYSLVSAHDLQSGFMFTYTRAGAELILSFKTLVAIVINLHPATNNLTRI